MPTNKRRNLTRTLARRRNSGIDDRRRVRGDGSIDDIVVVVPENEEARDVDGDDQKDSGGLVSEEPFSVSKTDRGMTTSSGSLPRNMTV